MKLPNGERAAVDVAKLSGYCLDPSHPRGRHKARVFRSALGLIAAHAEELRAALLAAARTEDATPAEHDEYGDRYVVDFVMTGPIGSARVRSAWIVRAGEDFPRLSSCFVM